MIIKNKIINLKYFFMILFGSLCILFYGCDTLEGIGGVEDEVQLMSQDVVEKYLIANTTLEEQNITIYNSLIQSLKNIDELQLELKNLEHNISQIQNNLANISEDNMTSVESQEFLSELDVLISKSNNFVKALENSTQLWKKHILKLKSNSSNLNFSEEINEEVYIESFKKPLEEFK